ncbi:hypothetical protein [Catenulispora rubra]|uniref:hypothetical protein n=1 Tax=Catenulispora rubra TaxID=280293 RepID=UPI001891F3AC|nr:hypothetical protein [Catenulispora rubra]
MNFTIAAGVTGAKLPRASVSRAAARAGEAPPGNRTSLGAVVSILVGDEAPTTAVLLAGARR